MVKCNRQLTCRGQHSTDRHISMTCTEVKMAIDYGLPLEATH